MRSCRVIDPDEPVALSHGARSILYGLVILWSGSDDIARRNCALELQDVLTRFAHETPRLESLAGLPLVDRARVWWSRWFDR